MKLVTTRSQLKYVAYELRTEGAFVVDVETTGLDWQNDAIEGIALATYNYSWYIPVSYEKTLDRLPIYEVVKELAPIFDDTEMAVGGHNIIFDIHFLYRIGLFPKGEWYDSMQLAHLWEDNLAESGKLKLLSLKNLGKAIFGIDMPTWEEAYAGKSLKEQADYAARDARVTYDLIVWFINKLKNEPDGHGGTLADYYHKYLIPLLPIVWHMEEVGWRIDRQALLKFQKELEEQRDEALARILAVADINVNSSKQIGEWLTKHKVKLPLTRTGQPSTSVKDLEAALEKKLKPDVRQFIEGLLAYRKANKLLTTYISNPRSHAALLDVADDNDRIHPRWNYCGTVSGRFSCSNPNLQNIPHDPTIRNWFIAAPKHKLIVADLSQAEVRMLAALSGDKKLIAALESEDIHSEIGSEVFGVQVNKHKYYLKEGHTYTGPYDELEAKRLANQGKGEVVPGSLLRFQAKTVVFGLIYGRSAHAIAEAFDIPLKEAEGIINRFFRKFPRVRRWIKEIQIQAERTGKVHMAFGRPRRPILLRRKPSKEPYLTIYKACYRSEMKKPATARLDGREAKRNRGRRQAVNSVIQGSVAELINQVLVKLYDPDKWNIVGQVHDEVILEVPEERVEEAVVAVKEALEVEVNGVKFRCDVVVCDRWGEAKD